MPTQGPVTSGRRHRDEQGSLTIQIAILLPLLFLLMFAGVQAALYYHARSVAIAAAQEAARAVAAQGGRTSDGLPAAAAFITTEGGAGVISSVRVTVQRGQTIVTVTVTGRAMSVLPGWNPSVTQTATAPVERLTAP